MNASSVVKKHQEAILSRELDPAFRRRAAWIAEHIALRNGHTVLDIGCGRGFYEMLLSQHPNVSITGIDLNPRYLAAARRIVKSPRVRFMQLDATRLPFADQTFDRVVASEVLEHVDDDRVVLKEMHRVLKKGGFALVTVPNKHYPILWDPLNWVLERVGHVHVPSHIWWLAGIWADHVRLYSVEEIRKVVQTSPLVIENVALNTHACIPFAHFFLYGVGKNIVERGWLPSLNRFNYVAKSSTLFRAVRRLVYSVDHRNNHALDLAESSVNILLKLRKRS